MAETGENAPGSDEEETRSLQQPEDASENGDEGGWSCVWLMHCTLDKFAFHAASLTGEEEKVPGQRYHETSTLPTGS